MWYSFLICRWGEGGDLPQHIKLAYCGSSECAHVRRASPSPRVRRQQKRPRRPLWFLFSSTHLQLVAAPPAPVHALGNHRCRLGWERGSVESRGDVAGPLPPVVRRWCQRAPRLRVGSAGVAAEGSSLGQSQRGRWSPPRASRDGRASSSRRPTPPPLAQVVAGAGGVAPGAALVEAQEEGGEPGGSPGGFWRWGGVPASGGRRPHCRVPRGRQRTAPARRRCADRCCGLGAATARLGRRAARSSPVVRPSPTARRGQRVPA